MKLEYKVIILSVMVGVLFIAAEMISAYFAADLGTGRVIETLGFLFEPLTDDHIYFIYAVILLICLVFGLSLSILIRQIRKERGVSKQTTIEKNMILDFVPEIVIYINENHKVKWVSRSLYRRSGLSESDVVNKSIFDLAKQLFPIEMIEPMYAEFIEKKEITVELKSFKNTYWQLFSNAIKNERNRITGYVFLAIDITETKKNEEFLRRSYEQLESNIEQFAIMADNIRNPLSGIVLLAETSQDQKAAEKIVKECENIEEVIADLDAGWSNSEAIRNFLKKHL